MPIGKDAVTELIKSTEQLVDLALSGELAGFVVIGVKGDKGVVWQAIGQSSFELAGATDYVRHRIIQAIDGRRS